MTTPETSLTTLPEPDHIQIMRICNWTHDDDSGVYETACGEEFEFYDAGPVENGFRFCPYCGKTLIDHPKEPTP